MKKILLLTVISLFAFLEIIDAQTTTYDGVPVDSVWIVNSTDDPAAFDCIANLNTPDYPQSLQLVIRKVLSQPEGTTHLIVFDIDGTPENPAEIILSNYLPMLDKHTFIIDGTIDSTEWKKQLTHR